MSVKKAMATGMFLQSKNEETLDFLAESISNSFSLLVNIDPYAALHVVEQLSSQFTEEQAEELASSMKESIEEVASQINLTEDDLYDED